ncbi:hypothetical protein [Bacillus salipaludis]|uniref:N-acetyltransferase domain-containing protein n=1 Tax=Bacillus salipaludis TaxID=2547811 RepID=A0ABW8RB81_9BACI
MEESYFISVDYNLHVNEDYDEEYPYLDGWAKITLHDEEGISKDIGSISFTIFHSNTLDDSFLIHDIADSVSGDMVHLINGFHQFSRASEVSYYEKVLCLNYIKIQKEYRKNSYGSFAISNIIKFSKILNVDFIILQPAPIEGEPEGIERKSIINRLTKFYSKFGFETFTTNFGDPIMIFDLEWYEL